MVKGTAYRPQEPTHICWVKALGFHTNWPLAGSRSSGALIMFNNTRRTKTPLHTQAHTLDEHTHTHPYTLAPTHTTEMTTGMGRNREVAKKMRSGDLCRQVFIFHLPLIFGGYRKAPDE